MKKNKLILLLAIAFYFMLPSTLVAQETKESFFNKNKITYGGKLWFSP